MTLPSNDRGRPVQEAASKMSDGDTLRIPPSPTEIAARVRDAYAVLVIGKAARRRVYFGLPAAQRAVDRATARGDYAEMVLVRLVPASLEPVRGEAS